MEKGGPGNGEHARMLLGGRVRLAVTMATTAL